MYYAVLFIWISVENVAPQNLWNTQYGIKIFWCCDSKAAYPLKGEVCVGRQSGRAVVGTKNTIRDLVKRFVRPWINKGRSVITDNYFTSVELAEDLLSVQTTLVGTIRKTNGIFLQNCNRIVRAQKIHPYSVSIIS